MTDPAEKPAIARNVLTNAALIRLTDWARQNVEQCQTLSNKTLATMAGETLNLHLTSANIASALEAVNITKIKPKAPPSLEERIAELETTVGTQGLHIAALEDTAKNHVVHLEALHANVNQLIRLVDDLERSRVTGWNIESKAREKIGTERTGIEPDLTLAQCKTYSIGIDLPETMPAGTVCPLPDFEKAAINASNTERLKESLVATDTDIKPHSESPSFPVS